MLLQLRDTYPVETEWAPPWVGNELRQVRRGADEARLAAIRAQAEAAAARRAGHQAAVARHETLAASYHATAVAYGEREQVFAGVMDDRRAWDRTTADRRRLAVAADAELRRRHPRQHFAPLRPAEPGPISDAQRDRLVLKAAESIPALEPWIQKLAADRAEFAAKIAERQQQAGTDLDLGHWPGPGGSPLLQPPKPLIRPSARMLERVNERAADLEAAT